jgi:hypothetical protein
LKQISKLKEYSQFACREIVNIIDNDYEIQSDVFLNNAAGRPSGPPPLLANSIHFAT